MIPMLTPGVKLQEFSVSSAFPLLLHFPDARSPVHEHYTAISGNIQISDCEGRPPMYVRGTFVNLNCSA
jgi:hypothetical protein